MKSRTKLIATLMAMCLVITLGVFGILAVKTLNMSVGGNITFTADGISFEVSKGEFKTTSGSEYTGITSQTGKLQGFAMNTNTKLSDVQDKINSWAGLDLLATESLGSPELHFTITNLMEDEILSIDPTIDLGTNINDNMNIVMTPSFANIEYGTPQSFVIKFVIKDTSINGGLTGFSIDMLMSTAYIAKPNEVADMTFAPTETGATYRVSNCSTATGEVVIPAYIKQGEENYAVTEIASEAFIDNKNITSITIPNTIKTIGLSAFSGCSELAGQLVIPSSVTSILGSAFLNCRNISGDLIIPDSVTTIGESAFANCFGLSGKLVLSKNITIIQSNAFEGCNGLTGELIIPEGVTEIRGRAFFVTGFTSCVIPNSVTKISNSVFENCYELKTITIGSGVKSIASKTFYCCTSLETITIGSTMPPTLSGELTFYGTNNCLIYVPNESYLTAEGWSVYASRMVVGVV